MNISVFIIECIMMAVLFGILVFGMLFTSSLTFISDYPPEIQAEAQKALQEIQAVKKIAALLVVLFLFAWMAHKAGAETFVQGLLAAYGYMVVLAVFDTCFLDWILFANIKRIRLPGTEHMEGASRGFRKSVTVLAVRNISNKLMVLKKSKTKDDKIDQEE